MRNDFLLAPVAAEHLRVHQHAARGRLVEPPEVQDRLGLAGAEEVPFAVHPGFDPGVVVVGVCPARRVDLAGGDAHGAEGGHRERTLFAASARGGLQGGEGRRGAGVGGLVGDVLVAPVVDFQHRLAHRESRHAFLQFLVVLRAEAVEGLVVHPCGQYEVEPLALGHLRPPGELAAGAEGTFGLLAVKLHAVVGHVGPGHVGIEKLEGLEAVVGGLELPQAVGEVDGLEVRAAQHEVLEGALVRLRRGRPRTAGEAEGKHVFLVQLHRL